MGSPAVEAGAPDGSSFLAREVVALERELDDTDDAFKQLSQQLARSHAEVREANARTAKMEQELDDSRAELAAMTRLKYDLAAALQREQDQRLALLEAVRSSSGESANIWSEQMRALEEENASLREDVHKLRFAVGIQAERAKDAKRLSSDERSSLQHQLVQAEKRREVVERELAESHADHAQLRTRADVTSEENLELREALARRENERLLAQNAEQRSADAKQQMQVESLQSEVGRLAERFQASLAKEQKRSKRLIADKAHEAASLREMLNECRTALANKDQQLIAQGALLRSLDSSLDRLIVN